MESDPPSPLPLVRASCGPKVKAKRTLEPKCRGVRVDTVDASVAEDDVLSVDPQDIVRQLEAAMAALEYVLGLLTEDTGVPESVA